MEVNRSHIVSGAIGFFMGVCFWSGASSFVDKLAGVNLPVKSATASMSSLMSENVADSVGEKEEAVVAAEDVSESESPESESRSGESASSAQSYQRSDASSEEESQPAYHYRKSDRFKMVVDDPNGEYIVTSSGGSFHTSLNCRYLKNRSHEIKHLSRSRAVELGYKDCPGC